MAGTLGATESGTHGIRRLARDDIAAAVKALKRRPLTDVAVHDARKHLKRARAMLRLLRPALGRKTYRRENAALRDAARPLSAIRDAKVLLETFDGLVARGWHPRNPAAALALRQWLDARREGLGRATVNAPRPLSGPLEALRAAHRRAAHWRTGRHGWSVLGPGFARAYRRSREALKHARAMRTPQSLHAWRRRTQSLWHMLRALQPLQPDSVAALSGQAHRLADCLGEHHDLTVLAGTLAVLASSTDRAAVEGLMPLIDRRRGALERRAFALGARLYRESPAAITRRFGRYYRRWRESPRAG